MLWEECVERPWCWFRRLCIILWYSWGCNAVTANGKYYHMLKSVVMSSTKKAMQQNSSGIGCFKPSSRNEERPDFDHIQLCSPDQSKLDSCFGDDQYTVWTKNRDEIVHELSFNIIEAMFHCFIAQNRYFFDVCTFQQINKRFFENWKLCRHHHGHHGKADSSISDIVEMKEMKPFLFMIT